MKSQWYQLLSGWVCHDYAMARTATRVQLSEEDRQTLLKWKRGPMTAHKLVRRASIVLAAAEGLGNKAMSERGLGSVHTIGLWRRRYAQFGIEGLQDEPKSGSPERQVRRRWPRR